MATPQEIIESVYGIFRRAPTLSEENVGAVFPQDQFIDILTRTVENANEVRPVIRCYQSAFGRKPDQSGLDYWVGQMHTASLTVHNLYGSFFAASECQALYPASLTNTQFVTACYQNVLQRSPDAGGLAFYVAKLDNAENTRAEVLQAFGEGPESQDLINPLILDWQFDAAYGSTTIYTGSFF